ncbi:MAG: putative addiction module antidote protein [Kiritimatiellae bacterium]|jgi:probable addiction module antidote protein|nr:putative addiction module antidote protein [Kiritimatiellia bacterium]
MAEHITKFDVSDYLTDEDSIAEYLNAILAENDQDLLLSAIGDIAKARGMKQIAEASGLGRESLYKALAPGAKPRFETVIKVLNVLGVNLTLSPAKHPA